MSNYSLEIISHHPTFRNKSLRKYYVEGIDTVGAWGDEPFEIKFTNHTWQKVQVKLSVDGTDVLTGDLATTDPTPKMWVVNGYGTLSLKAWPEDNNGGAALVFTSGSNSVAAHTHGDMSNRGIIAAAVYTEGHVPEYPPIVINNNYPIRRRSIVDYDYYSAPIWTTNTGSFGGTLGGGTYSSSGTVIPAAGSAGGTSDVFTCSFNASDSLSSGSLSEAGQNSAKGLESLVAVGAGQHVDQKITYTSGLIKPTFTETVRVKYMWWDDLVAKLRQHNVPAPHASGFPGDKHKEHINLGSTPRVGQYGGRAFPREATPIQSYLRV